MEAQSNKKYYAAADLGASSGRVILGTLEDGRFTLQDMHRFSNGPIEEDGTIRWDIRCLFENIKEGINKAIAYTNGELQSVGIDTWGVDYGLLDQHGELLENPYHYRDSRTETTIEEFSKVMSPVELYKLNGLQAQPFNTIYQLVAAAGDPNWDNASKLLFTPDLLNYWLTGKKKAEVTIASTSGLLDVARRRWSESLSNLLEDQYEVPVSDILAELVEPGTVIGLSSPGVLNEQIPVIAVGSHDTASAVAAIPSKSGNLAYISSGTWSLVGVELDRPILTEESLNSHITNELGAWKTVRYLQNIMGMWVFNECRNEWPEQGIELSLAQLDKEAALVPSMQCVIDINDERLFPPGDMLGRLAKLAAESGQTFPKEPGAVLRCIDDSLALAYRNAIRSEEELSGQKVEVVHIVGGGSKNGLLCQLTAEATGVPVVAGPTEGTALGNLLVQAQATGEIAPGMDALRAVALASVETKEYSPGKLGIDSSQWDEANERLR